jgi:AbrB family looped-hinge helix DNA binding protein
MRNQIMRNKVLMPENVLQIRSNGQITLPASTRRAVNLEEGDLLEVIVEEDGSIRLIPKIAVDRSQAYFWTKRWQEGEREAEEDMRLGRVKEFKTMKDAIKFLDERDERG